MRALVTGGCGFIGHHLVEHIIKNTDWEVVVFDKLTYASSGFDRLKEVMCFYNNRVTFYTIDFTQPISQGIMKEVGNLDYIFHLGAETHVDNSIANPEPFVMSNVVGTMRLLDFARIQKKLKWFVYFSTDEVFGCAPSGIAYKEWDRYNSTNPYSASKAGGEELCLAYANTYGVPLFITHTMNTFGERQHPEKFIPSTIRKVLAGEQVIIHSDSLGVAGSRNYIHARNVSAALMFLLSVAKQREKYNIVGEKEVDNLTMAQFIAEVLGKELSYETTASSSVRPGHDLRYALDGAKMKELGWLIPYSFESSLRKTVEWYLLEENGRWLTNEKFLY